MGTEVLSTRRADQQIKGLTRRHAKAFDDFLNDLAVRGCQALAYRLTGETPVDHICVKHLRGSSPTLMAARPEPPFRPAAT